MYGRPEEGEPDWEDNSVSNGMAALSNIFLPKWCKKESHWTIIVANYFWAECSCCLFWRGVVVGGLLGGASASMIAAII